MRIKNVIPVLLILMMVSVVYAEEPSSDNTLAASASSTATGTETHVEAGAIYSNGNIVAMSQASAKGEEIHLLSQASAQGVNVHGEGKASVIGKETISVAQVVIDKISESINRITVIVEAFAQGDASGDTYVFAYADDGITQGNNDATQSNAVQGAVQGSPVFSGGFVFGKSDAERYYHFKNQANLNCPGKDDETNYTCHRAKYYLDIITNDNRLNETQFEHKYTLENVIKMDPGLVAGK